MIDAMTVALGALGDRWALLVVREVSLGVRRFDDLHRLTGAPRAVLSERLARLVAAGILATREYRVPGQRARQEYALTDAGIDVLPVLAALSDWGSRHLPDAEPRAIDYRHLGCGGRVSAQLRCACGELLDQRGPLIAQVNR